MFKVQRSHPLYRLTNTVITFTSSPPRGVRKKLTCWSTQRGRSVTRLTGLARGELLRQIRRGNTWGFHHGSW